MNLARYQSVPGIFQCCGAWLAPEHAVLAHRLALCDRNETVTVCGTLCFSRGFIWSSKPACDVGWTDIINAFWNEEIEFARISADLPEITQPCLELWRCLVFCIPLMLQIILWTTWCGKVLSLSAEGGGSEKISCCVMVYSDPSIVSFPVDLSCRVTADFWPVPGIREALWGHWVDKIRKWVWWVVQWKDQWAGRQEMWSRCLHCLTWCLGVKCFLSLWMRI